MSSLREPIGHIVTSFIRVQEEADRCKEEYLRVKNMPGYEAEAAKSCKKAKQLTRKAARLLRQYRRLKQNI